MPDGLKAYVANTVSGTVTVIPLNIRNGVISRPSKHIVVGTQPYGLALTPNGKKLYVSNSRSDSVSVIDTSAANQEPSAFQRRKEQCVIIHWLDGWQLRMSSWWFIGFPLVLTPEAACQV